MKKFGKILLGAVSVAAVIGGAYCVLKNVFKKDSCEDDFEDFEDDMDDLDDETTDASENREYVSIKITSEDDKVSEEAPADAAPEAEAPADAQ